MFTKVNCLFLLWAGIGWAQNLYPENTFLTKLELGSKLFSDQHYSYSGRLELNIPVIQNLAVRPRLGGTFFTNKFSREEINSFDYGLEMVIPQTKVIPVSFSALATRELLYSEREWKDFSRVSLYHEIYGFIRVGLDKSFPIGRLIRVIPEFSNWFFYSKEELDRVTGLSISVSHFNGPFINLAYANIATESREDLQHSFGISIGVVAGRGE